MPAHCVRFFRLHRHLLPLSHLRRHFLPFSVHADTVLQKLGPADFLLCKTHAFPEKMIEGRAVVFC